MGNAERERRLHDLEEMIPQAQAAVERELDEDLETHHLRSASDRLRAIESEIEALTGRAGEELATDTGD